MDITTWAKDVGTLSREVGAFMRTEQRKITENQVETKSLNSLVSYVDKRAEALFVEGLAQIVPQAGFWTEEETVDRDSSQEFTWVVDPLDGTTNFLHGLPIFSTSVALLHHGEPIIGVVYEVGMDELFVGVKGHGATLNGQPIQVTQTAVLSNSLLATGFPYYNFDKLAGFQSVLAHFYQHTRGIRRFGTAAVDLCYTACGRFDGYYEYGLNPWDVLAGVVIVREAGGKATDFTRSETGIDGSTIVVSNGPLHNAILAPIEEHMM